MCGVFICVAKESYSSTYLLYRSFWVELVRSCIRLSLSVLCPLALFLAISCAGMCRGRGILDSVLSGHLSVQYKDLIESVSGIEFAFLVYL